MLYLFILVGAIFVCIYLTCYVDYKIYKKDWEWFNDEDEYRLYRKESDLNKD